MVAVKTKTNETRTIKLRKTDRLDKINIKIEKINTQKIKQIKTRFKRY